MKNNQIQGNLCRDCVRLHQHHHPTDQLSDFIMMMLIPVLQLSAEDLLHQRPLFADDLLHQRHQILQLFTDGHLHLYCDGPKTPFHNPHFSSNYLPYDPLNPLEPPNTASRQYTTVTDRAIPNDPTSPISSAEAASPPDKRPKSPSLVMPPPDRSHRSDISSALRTKSLPSSRRRKHHHRSRAHRQITKPIAAPVTITPTVTLMEALPIEEPDNAASASRPKKADPTTSRSARSLNLAAKSKSTTKPSQEVVPDSDSEYTYVTISSESESPKQPRRRSTKSPTEKNTIRTSVPTDTAMLKARVLFAMASYETTSLQDFNNYLKRTNLKFFDPTRCTDDKPYKCICIFGPPNVGKSDAALSLNSYMNGVRQFTSSKKFYKWTCESNNTNLSHYTNDSFANDSGINWDNLIRSFDCSLQHLWKAYDRH